LTLGEELVAVLDNLMGTANEVHVVFLQEARHHIRAEGEGNTTVVLTPSRDILVGVGPQQVAEEPAVGDLRRVASASESWQGSRERQSLQGNSATYIGRAHDSANLLHRVQIWTQTTMHGENLLVNDRGNREAVEAIRECLPQLNVVPTLALIIKSVDPIDRGAFVVASQDEEVLRILDLVGQKEADGFQRLLAAVDVVSKEEVVGLGREAAILKEPKEIIVLAVDVTADLEEHDEVSRSRGHDTSGRHTTRASEVFEAKGFNVCLTLMGASNSSRIGWEMNISRALVQR